MDFEKGIKTARVLYSALNHEFDVRADGAIDESAAAEMAKGKFDNPLVTADLVVIDGRTAALAQLLKAGMPSDDKAYVEVDMLPFRYSTLSQSERSKLMAFSLQRNFSQRYRRFSTEEDVVSTISQVIRGYWPNVRKTAIQELFPFLGSRFSALYDNALNAVRQQKISQARAIMKDPNINTAQAAKMVGLPTTDGIIQTKGTGVRDKTFNEMKEKQAAVQRAVTFVKNYADSRLKLLREGRISGLTVKRLYDHEDKQVNKLNKIYDDAKRRVEKELVEYIPGYHTK
jgi:hypothetical protein